MRQEGSNAEIKSIRSLENDYFFVAEYQRGYKWGLPEVEFLLDDIFQFDPDTEKFYCLQPIVLKYFGSKKSKRYELIDGQQRLSTIYLILKCLDLEIFDLDYQTRKSSQQFIDKIIELEEVKFNIADEFEKNVKVLQTEWQKYIEVNKDKNNIDNYHFFNAYHYIYQWVKSCSEDELSTLKTNLLDYTKVIWYNIDEYNTNNLGSEEIFVNFNDGKIALAQAELIKALFVLQFNDIHNIELRSFQLNQFADQWNRIEHKLQDNQFWFFISNDISDSKKYNRIDLLFDMVQEKPKNSDDDFYSYDKYYETYQKPNNEEKLNWEQVINMFNMVQEWYDNRVTFHLIGYIVHEKIKTVNQLINEYTKFNSKKEFEERLRIIIKKAYFEHEKVDKRKKYEIDYISYGEHTKEIHSILTLFNIATYHITDAIYRFPFDLLKKESGWSLEHIHAINTDDFTTKKDILEWLDDVENIIEAYKSELKEGQINVIEGVIEKLKVIVNELEGENRINKEVKGLINSLEESIEGFFNKDALSNICLLDLKTNIILSKKFFKQKRKEILFFDTSSIDEIKEEHPTFLSKPFIPIATKNVFQKYYTTEENKLQMTYWGIEDRKFYLENMKALISKFLNIKK